MQRGCLKQGGLIIFGILFMNVSKVEGKLDWQIGATVTLNTNG